MRWLVVLPAVSLALAGCGGGTDASDASTFAATVATGQKRVGETVSSSGCQRTGQTFACTAQFIPSCRAIRFELRSRSGGGFNVVRLEADPHPTFKPKPVC
jgi:hypothetical protein